MNWPQLPNVSRETNAKLAQYADLLVKWNPRINLVSRSSLEDLWSRHVTDSVQIYHSAPKSADHWADLGSGGGFPGLVIAILAAETGAPAHVTLVESDQRKCVFLRTVLRELGLAATILAERIESIAPLDANILSARALADLDQLFRYCERHLAPGGCAVFPKGANWKKELEAAQSKWRFSQRIDTSKTEPGSAILLFTGVARV